MLDSASHFQIHGGDFTEIRGDFSLHLTPASTRHTGNPLAALESGLSEGGRRLRGVERSDRQAGAARILPYDASRRPQLLHHSYESGVADQRSSSRAPYPSPISQPRSGFTWPISSEVMAIDNFEAPVCEVIRSDRREDYSPQGYQNHPNSDIPDDHPPLFPSDHRARITICGNVNHIQHHGDPGLHILYRAAAGDATHDAEDRFPQPKCHPMTREKMLATLWNWTSGTEPSTGLNYEDDADNTNTSSSDKPSSPILWLQGPAGSGKSAIAQTLCHNLEEKGCLGASFFFKRGHPSRGHAKRLITTIAYQLARRLPDLSRHISWSVESDPSLVDKSLSIQLQRLIVDPWVQSGSTCPLVVIIDGLDECEDQNVQQQILCLIGHAVQGQQLALRFLISSRPEPHIREIFLGALSRIHCPVNIEQSFEDVRRYLLNEFARIRREHHETMTAVGLWPCQKDIHNLVWHSSGYFIYASTVIKFIDDKDFCPTERLKVIVGTKDPDFGPRPFAALDQLYTQILDQVHARPELVQVLTVVVAELFWEGLQVGHIEQLLELNPGSLRLILRGLRSLIKAKKKDGSDSNDWSFESEIVVHHASFSDFLQDPTRAGKFYVSSGPHLTDLCRYIFKAWCYRYEDRSANRQGHVSWCLPALRVFELIDTLEPSSDLLQLLRHFNPDFWFESDEPNEEFESLLAWLKRGRPLAGDLIQLWENYRFMLHCADMWCKCKKIQVSGQDRDRACRILSLVSPSLIRILQAAELTRQSNGRFLLELHTIFNFPWEELRAVICSLRPLLGTEGDEIFKAIYIVALDPTIFAQHSDSLLWDKVSGSLRFMMQTLHGEVEKERRTLLAGWTQDLKLCQPCPLLLRDLCDLEPFFNDPDISAYSWDSSILDWLKTFPQPPLAMISRFEGYLEKKKKTMEDDERRWDSYFSQDRL